MGESIDVRLRPPEQLGPKEACFEAVATFPVSLRDEDQRVTEMTVRPGLFLILDDPERIAVLDRMPSMVKRHLG